ncbi:hypothetical protein ACSVDE_10980 [Pseudalkalibacillus sp. Hm43]|uniref:hypothetical protein n=1 Tax=Pseudalkalibacillus sp. Hm43 TaxID=3450742 RepID=UPI003F43EECD
MEATQGFPGFARFEEVVAGEFRHNDEELQNLEVPWVRRAVSLVLKFENASW